MACHLVVADLGPDIPPGHGRDRGIPDVIVAVKHRSPAVDELLLSEDMIEGLKAFAAKRPPRWRNR